MNRTYVLIATAGIALLLSFKARAQAPPFFSGAAGIFEPEIGVVQSGVILDAQAVVLADRKYVTLNTRLQNTQLLALREFAFQTGGGAGRAHSAAATGVGAARAAAGSDDTSREEPLVSSQSRHAVPRKPYPLPGKAAYSGTTPILDKSGMTLIGRVRTAESR